MGDETNANADDNRENGINYIEFPMLDAAATEQFYGSAFGWQFQHWGEDYMSFNGAVVEGGFHKVESMQATEHPQVLVIMYTANLEAKLDQVRQAGGRISQDIFSFPGGRRFHFLDPNGNQLAVWSEK